MKSSGSFSLAIGVLAFVFATSEAFVPLSLKSNSNTNTNTNNNTNKKKQRSTPKRSSTTRLFYDIQRDPQPNDNVWAILSNTEKWISTTLAEAQRGASGTNGANSNSNTNNPLSRKEVSYVCETSGDPAMILANIFRKVKEARQLGEAHAQDQEALVEEKGEDKHNRVTLRQTQVLVIPANEQLSESFHTFDAVIAAINEARRAARDLVTDYSLEKLDEQLYGENDEKDWVVSVNCAHLHPKYGEKTPEQQLQELKEEEEEGEIDLNLREYKRQRTLARRSPYPSVVIEVRAMAPPEFTPPPARSTSIDGIDTPYNNNVNNNVNNNNVNNNNVNNNKKKPSDGSYSDNDSDDAIDADFVNQLEALFSKSSLDSNSGNDGNGGSGSKDGDFYESIGSHIETFTSVTPLMIAQNWIDKNDPDFDITKCSFTVSDATHVDEAYEFLFTNLGMQTARFLSESNSESESESEVSPPNNTSDDGTNTKQKQKEDAQKRQYMVLPHFLSSSATSLEKFAARAQTIVGTLPTVGTKVALAWFHPESVDENKRCPVPVLVLQWKTE